MRLIDRDALADALGIAEDCSYCESKDGIFCCKKSNDFVDACEAIFEAPTIEERKTGRWVEYNYPGSECVYCSHCKEEYYPDDILLGRCDYPNFCPNCGADMRGGNHETP